MEDLSPDNESSGRRESRESSENSDIRENRGSSEGIRSSGSTESPGNAPPVFQAARSGDVATLRELLTNDPQLLNQQDYGGNTPLLCAAQSGSVECLQYCLDMIATRNDLDLGEEINRTNGARSDPITLAVWMRSIECVQLLFASGAKTVYRRRELLTSPLLYVALRDSTVEITRLILRTLVYHTPSKHYFWTEAMSEDLSDTWKKFKLLEEYGFPFSPENCNDVCGELFKCKPSDPDLEEFILHLCSLLKRRSDETVEQGLRDLNAYCLRVVVPYKGSFDIIRHLQNSNLYRPPSDIEGWTDAFSYWHRFLPELENDDKSKVETLIHELILSKSDSTPGTRPFLHNSDFGMVVLYAVLILLFPHPSWHDKQPEWLELVRSMEQKPSEWPSLMENSMYFISSYFKVLLEQVTSALENSKLGRGIIKQELFHLMDRLMKSVDLSDIEMMFGESVSEYLATVHEDVDYLILENMRQYILPHPLSNACFDGWDHNGLLFIIESDLFETIMDYSPELALQYLLHAGEDEWGLSGEESRYFNTASLENDQAIHRRTHDCPMNTMYPMRAPRDSKCEPLSLCVLTKRALRCHLRHLLYFGSKLHRKPLSSSINQLPLPEKMRHWLNRCDNP